MYMNLAYTMAVKSNCISRQVGAVIVSPEGHVVGAGWNDVGKGQISCGLRAIGDLPAIEIHAEIANPGLFRRSLISSPAQTRSVV
jgi:tRNA(Arg) A34 adenosine deaminase TadA